MGFGENTHELEKNAKILEEKNTIIREAMCTRSTCGSGSFRGSSVAY